MQVQDAVGKIQWLGHDGFRINAERVICIDPYEVDPGPKADVILVTHEHFDHCSPADVEKLKHEKTVIITEKDSAAKLSGDIRIVSPGETITLDAVTVETVAAYNVNKNFHPKAKGWLGFVVTVDGIRIYHAGDTDFIPEMKALDVDIALLPVSGTYVMTAAEAVEAALAIGPKIAVPMHYGSIVGAVSDAETFRSALEGKIDVHILARA